MDRRQYRRAVSSQTKADILGKHTPTHLFWGLVPVVVGAGVGLFLALLWGPATFSPFIDIVIPLISGLAGLLLSLIIYVGYHRLRAPRQLYQANLTTLAATQSELDHAKKAIKALRQAHVTEITSLAKRHTGVIEALRLERESAALTVTAFTDPLPHSWGSHLPEERIQIALLERRFAVLRVTNEGHKNLHSIVATCQFAEASDGKCV